MDRAFRMVSVLAAMALLTASQRTSPVVPADPAADLVRARLFASAASSGLDLTIDGARVANAVFTLRSGFPAIRMDLDGNTLRMTRNVAGTPFDAQIDLILAGVPAGASVGWTLSAAETSSGRLEVRNANAAPTSVDTFDFDGVSARFSTASDLLRRGGPLGSVTPVTSRLVLAFFYPWWHRDTWSSPIFMDAPVERYSTDDPADLARVMGQAKSAGIDALVVSWSGRDFDGGIDHRRMLACLSAAQTSGMRVATLFETTVANPAHEDGTADPGTVFRWLVDVVDGYASSGAYLRVGGRPVVLAYAAQRMAQAGWADALDRLRATGRDVLLIGEGINATRLGALDGLFYYPSNLYQGDAIRDFDRTQSLSVRTYHLLPGDAGRRRIWAATVSPGYDDTHLQDGRVARTTGREDGKYYDRQWQSALDMRADWVVITSWNEWFENTEIEPSLRYGDRALAQTRRWADQFRGRFAVPRR